MMAVSARPTLQAIGSLMDIVITYLADAHFKGSMEEVKVFAQFALMAADFANALRPIIRRWKHATKHDRALVRQVKQNNNWCGFEDMWILQLALDQPQGDALSLKTCMQYPLGCITTIYTHEAFDLGAISTTDAFHSLWCFGLTISACLSPQDKFSLSSLCTTGLYILRASKTNTSDLFIPYHVYSPNGTDSSDDDTSSIHTNSSATTNDSSSSD